MPAAATAAGSAAPAPRLSPAFAALVLALLMALQPVTTDLMLPALPALAADLRAPMAPVQLTMSALILAFGLAVTGLKRVRIGSVVLGKLPPGQWRYLRPDERF